MHLAYSNRTVSAIHRWLSLFFLVIFDAGKGGTRIFGQTKQRNRSCFYNSTPSRPGLKQKNTTHYISINNRFVTPLA